MPPIDFSNVNVTIQQFQKISSGKYNAGEQYGDNPPADSRVHVAWKLPGGQKVDLLANGSLADVAPAIPKNNSVAILDTAVDGLKAQLDPKTANERLLAVLGTPKMPPHHAAALITASSQNSSKAAGSSRKATSGASPPVQRGSPSTQPSSPTSNNNPAAT